MPKASGAKPSFLFPNGTRFCKPDTNPRPLFMNPNQKGRFTCLNKDLKWRDARTGEIDLMKTPFGHYQIWFEEASGAHDYRRLSSQFIEIVGTWDTLQLSYPESVMELKGDCPRPWLNASALAGHFWASSSDLVFISESGLHSQGGVIDLQRSKAGNYRIYFYPEGGCVEAASTQIALIENPRLTQRLISPAMLTDNKSK